MTEVDLVARSGQPTESAGLTARPPLTLAEEHVLLLWQVTASAEKLLTATEHGRWPGAELAALAGYAQAEVLRQVSDEEALLFPAVPAQTAAGLARDHVRLRAAAELLARAAAGEQPMSPAQLAAAVRNFVVQLERHLRNEDDLLASGRAPQRRAGHRAPRRPPARVVPAHRGARGRPRRAPPGPSGRRGRRPAAADAPRRAGRTAVRHQPGPGVAGARRAQPGRLPVHRPAGRAGPVADAGHPPPGSHLTDRAARIPRLRRHGRRERPGVRGKQR